MQPELEHDAGVAAAAIEVRHVALDGEYGAHGVGRIVKRRHDRVADGLNNEAVMGFYPF